MSRQKEDPILRDQVDDVATSRKRFRIVTVLLVVFVLVMFAGITLDIVFGIKLTDRTKEHQDAQALFDQMNAEEEKMKLDRNLDLSNTNLLDFSLELNDPLGLEAEPIIENLNLTRNKLAAFRGNKIFSLKQLYLEGNTIKEFGDNRLDNLQKFSIEPLASLTNFSGNTMPTITNLQVSELNDLINFNDNVLDNLVNLSLPINLINFNRNHLRDLQNLDLALLDNLISFEGNLLPISSLTIDNPKLVNFAKSEFPNLTNLVVLRNNFTDITISNFNQLQSIRINGTASSNGNTVSLDIRHTPKLTQLSVVLPTVKDAWIEDTSLTSFPDINSDLNGLISLVLQDNTLMTLLLVSKMKNVENYEIINTPIEKTDTDSQLKELEFSDTSLKAFKGWKLQSLESLIIQRNVNMTTFKDNDLQKLTTLTVADQDFTESTNNTFPLLKELKLTNVPLKCLNYTSDATNMQLVELVKNSPDAGSTYDASIYPNLKGLTINSNDYAGLLLDNKLLTSVVVSIPNLKQLTVRNSPLADLSKIQKIDKLLKLEVTDSALTQLETTKLNFLTDLKLSGLSKLTTLPTDDIEELATVSLSNIPLLKSLSFRNKQFLTSMNLQLNELNTLELLYPRIPTFEGQVLPQLSNLTINSDNITTLTLDSYPNLALLSLRMSKLTSLTIGKCQVKSLNGNTLDALTDLTLSEVPLTADFNYRYPALLNLAINNINNPTLVTDFVDMKKLVKLEMLNNSIANLAVGNLNDLTTLTLGTANLKALSLNALPSLATLTFPLQPSQYTLQSLSVDNVPYFTAFSNQNWPTVKTLSIQNSPTSSLANNALPALTSLELVDITATSLDIIKLPSLNALRLNIPALTDALHLEDLPQLTSLANCLLDNLGQLTVTSVPLTTFVELPALVFLGMEGVQFDTFDFALIPTAEIVYIKDSPIRKLDFPGVVANLGALQLDNVKAQGGISGANFSSLYEIIVTRSPDFDGFNNNNFTKLQELVFDGTSIQLTDLLDNDMPTLERLTLSNSANAAGIPDVSNIKGILKYYKLESIKLASFGNGCDLTALEELYILGNNQLATLQLPASIATLKTLVIENSALATFTGYTYPALTSLSIHDTGVLETFTTNTFSALKDLTLSGLVKTTELSNTVNLPALQQLIIRDSPGYTTLSGRLFNNLKFLQIINNPNFNTYSTNNFAALTNLDLRSNALTNFSNQNLLNLVALNLQDNQVTEFKSNTFSVIEQLSLDNNKLDTADDLILSINGNANLRVLTLENNQIPTFPAVTLAALEILNLASNQLTDLAAPVAAKLKILNVENNNLQQLPPLAYADLTDLWASNNNILGGDVSNLPALTKFKLASNGITDFANFGHPNLQFLEIGSNNIADLGQPSLPKLLLLDVSKNQLTDATLLASLTPITVNPGLKYLNIAGNTLTDTVNTVAALQARFASAQIITQ